MNDEEFEKEYDHIRAIITSDEMYKTKQYAKSYISGIVIDELPAFIKMVITNKPTIRKIMFGEDCCEFSKVSDATINRINRFIACEKFIKMTTREDLTEKKTRMIFELCLLSIDIRRSIDYRMCNTYIRAITELLVPSSIGEWIPPSSVWDMWIAMDQSDHIDTDEIIEMINSKDGVDGWDAFVLQYNAMVNRSY